MIDNKLNSRNINKSNLKFNQEISERTKLSIKCYGWNHEQDN